MAVFRIERTRDYTVMSNHHLRNANLSLKAKGLLSMMLSLPEDWNYTTRGLAKICKEGVDAIGAALRELEGAGYIVRHQRRDKSGRITDTEYVIYEQPQPDLSQPDTASPDTENPDTEKPAELNIEKSNTEKSITYGSSTDSIPFRETAAAGPPERKGRDAMSVTEIENYRELILENIEYDCLKRRYPLYRDDLNEIVELLVETVCAKRKTTRISGADFPHEIVRSRFLKLDSSHIEFVMDCLQKNTTQVRNMKQYLLAVLFNAPIDGKQFPNDRIAILKEIGSFIEAPSFYANLTGRENLDIIRRILGLPKADVEDALELVGLTEFGDRLAKKYSLGMKQRLGLAGALLGRPPILILDEPTNGLDPSGIHEIRNLVKSLPDLYDCTVLISSHMLSEIELIADDIGILNHGRLLFEGSMNNLRQYALQSGFAADNLEDVFLSMVEKDNMDRKQRAKL